MNEVFSFKETKSGNVFISWQGKTVTTLAGDGARRFLARAEGADAEGLQQLMARATGNCKHGKEL